MRDYFTAIKCDVCGEKFELNNGAYLRKGMMNHKETFHVKIFEQYNWTKQILRFDICQACLSKLLPGWDEEMEEQAKIKEAVEEKLRLGR